MMILEKRFLFFLLFLAIEKNVEGFGECHDRKHNVIVSKHASRRSFASFYVNLKSLNPIGYGSSPRLPMLFWDMLKICRHKKRRTFLRLFLLNYREAIGNAFFQWSKVIPLMFRDVTGTYEHPDITFIFSSSICKLYNIKILSLRSSLCFLHSRIQNCVQYKHKMGISRCWQDLKQKVQFEKNFNKIDSRYKSQKISKVWPTFKFKQNAPNIKTADIRTSSL